MSYRATTEMKSLKSVFNSHFDTFRDNEFYITEGSATGEGYHHSREDLIHRGKTYAYSIQHAKDKKGDAEAASAFDLLFDDDDELFLATERLNTAARNKDPRVFGFVREFGGTLDGKKVTAFNVTEQRSISFDKTHLWHLHVSVHREYTENLTVLMGIADVLCGVPLKTVPLAPFKAGDDLETKDVATAYYDLKGKVRAQVAKGYDVEAKKLHLVGDVWWVESAVYFYKASDLKKRVPAPAPVPKVIHKYLVTTDKLNVRSNGSTANDNNISGVAKKNQRVSGYEVTAGGRVWVVDSKGNYFARQYLLPYTTYLTTDKLNARSGPGTGYKVVKVVDKGEYVLVATTSKGWAQDVESNYFSLEYLKKV